MSEAARVRELLRRIQETDSTPEEVCRDCPELLGEVRDRWSRMRVVDAELDALFSDATDAGATNSGRDAAPAPEFPGYEIMESLGSGGMGVVWKARELSSGRLVALKVVHPHLRGLPGFAERLTREAEIGRQVVHENVVRTLGLAMDATRVLSRQALVTEYVEGQTLRSLLAEMGCRETVREEGLVRLGSHRVPEQLCRHIGREIAKGLAAIHAAGAVHRDLKPDNVLITKDNVVKVMDLGVARVLDVAASLSQPGAFVGSLRYAAPEQLRGGGPVDGRADVFALGLTLFELATGRHRDDAAAPKRPRASEVAPGLSPLFDELVAQCLREDPDERFPHAADVARILDEGESSAWWKTRAVALHARTPLALGRVLGRRETSMAGRDAEVRRLSELFERVTAGDGRVVLVEGEAGIGKSRVIEEFATSLLRDARADVLFGGYAPGGAATAMEAFATALRDHFGEARLEEALLPHLAPADDLVPPFAALLRRGVTPAGREPLSKDARNTAFVRTVQSLARTRPVVVVIEDLHFAPEEGRALFAAVASAIAGHAVLLVGTSRRSLDQRWAAELARLAHVSRLSVGRLGADDVAALVGELLGATDVASEVAAKLWTRTDGNPYFVFETLRDLRETRLLTRRADGALTPARSLAEIRVAPSIGDLIRARVAALAAEERELVQVAACCGFEFDPHLVGDVLGLDRFTLLRRLGVLETGHGLVCAARRSYAFDHHSVQEVIHDSMSEIERETFHAAIGAALETRATARHPAAEVPPVDCVALADHFLRGAAGERALPYLERALDHLLGGFHHDAAHRLAAHALAANELLAGAGRSRVALLDARALAMLGRAPEEAASLAEAVAAAKSSGDPVCLATALREMGTALNRRSHSAEGRAALEEAGRLCVQTGDRAGEAAVLRSLGTLHFGLSRMEDAVAHFERSRAICREVGDRRGEAMATGSLATTLQVLTRFDEAIRLHREYIAIMTELGDLQLRMRGMSSLANALLAIGRLEDGLELQEECVRKARQVGDRHGEAITLCNLAIAMMSQGRLGEARARLERSVALFDEVDSRRGVAVAANALGDLHSDLGAFELATKQNRRAFEVARAFGFRVVEAHAEERLAAIAAAEGREDEALAGFDRSVAIAEELGLSETTATAHFRRGAVLADLGRTAEAVESLDRALAVARTSRCHTVLVAAAAERARLPGGDARQAAAWLDEHGEGMEFVGRTRANWRLWQATGDPRRLVEAKRLLRFLVEHAPEDARISIIENVRVHREIAAAAEPPTT